MQYKVKDLATNVLPTAFPKELLERLKKYKGLPVHRISKAYWGGDLVYKTELQDGSMIYPANPMEWLKSAKAIAKYF